MQNKEDFEILQNMGFKRNFITKVYAFLHPESIMEAIQYMTTENGKYGHNFIESEENKSKCYICGFPLSNHINADINNDEINELNNITKGNEIKSYESKNKNNICKICGENNSQMIKNEQCNDSFCYNCWINYLKEKINTNILDKIPCMNYTCGKILSKKFIESLLKNNPSLLSKYEKFLERIQILNDPHKKFCPYPDCDSYAEEKKDTKFVKCEKNGHKFCYKCLKDHEQKTSCDEELYKDFKIWKKNKIVKQCPNCGIWVQKIDGCNHVTCSICKYDFCFVCLKSWIYHPDISCNGITEEMLKFFKPFNFRTEPEIENQNNNLIMITNISDKTSSDQLKKYLEIYGKTKSVDLIKDKTVFAFCEYLSDKFAKRALREKNLIIDGNKLEMKLISKEFRNNYYREQEEEKKKKLQAEYEEHRKNELCIKGLPNNLNEKTVKDYFEKFGKIKFFRLLSDYGLAFCKYVSADVAKNLVQKGTINYQGNILTVKYSKEKESKENKDKNSFSQNNINKQSNYNSNNSNNLKKNENNNLNKTYTLFVGNLNYQTTEEGLKNFFKEYGVVSVRIIKNQLGKSKGYGFVDFDSLDNLNKALSKNGKQLDSRNIRLNIESA